MTIDCVSVPKHLKVMRAITGLQEEPGSKDNPKILGMRDWIACTYSDVPGMIDYCEQYTHDEIAWCGLTAAFCCTVAGHMPPFKQSSDTDCFLWAQSFASDPNFVELQDAVLGAICVMTREGGGHVTFFESWANSDHSAYKGRGGNQSDEINVATFYTDDLIGFYWPRGLPLPTPAPEPPAGHETIEEGDAGYDVEQCQRILGLPIDGEFGGQTEAGVMGFQDAVGLGSDGVVGPMTWAELDKLDARVREGGSGLEPQLEAEIVQLAKTSNINSHSWKDRGRSPPGYIAGMALSFALAMRLLAANDSSALLMAQAAGDPDIDALAWYEEEFERLGMANARDGLDTLRHLFVLMIGLGMRESSGNHWEGRDQSASNTSPDSAEAGLFQTSWDIRSASGEIPRLGQLYWDNPNGFHETFTEGLSPSQSQLQNYGNGTNGTAYQWLAKYCPAFAVMMTGCGLRTRRAHWGPINRYEVELQQGADDLLRDVQILVAPTS